MKKLIDEYIIVDWWRLDVTEDAEFEIIEPKQLPYMTQEQIEKIMALVKETFSQEITTTTWENAEGLWSTIVGMDEFFEALKTKLQSI